MTKSSKINSKNNNTSDIKNKSDRTTNSQDLSQNPEYQILLEQFQFAEFKKCKSLLAKLEEQYPGDELLAKFREDLELKLSFRDIESSIRKDERKKKKLVARNLSIFGIIAGAAIVVVFLLAYFFFSGALSKQQQEEQTALLSSLEYQAEQLLNASQPQPAAEIIDRMKTIDPDYENLSALTSRADELLNLEANYQQALALMGEDKYTEALEILNGINANYPGLWDVNKQIAFIETSFQVSAYTEEGNQAFLAGDWQGVIQAYEAALDLDPKLVDPLMSEQLLQGYLNRIISMLGEDDTTIEDIENAEEYYRKAVAMAPQSKAFASERGNLQKASSNLLELKFTQMAKAKLEDKNQTPSTVAEAVAYMRKAANIQPNNSALSTDLKNAEYYQIAFKNFLELNWEQTITNLSQISSVDANYADGNARILLYEAYYALGKQYASVGLYLDAVTRLEQAEILAWNDSDNLLKLFQVQVLLGETLGKLRDYENAVSYYNYALNAIDADTQLTAYQDINRNLSQANVLRSYSDYEEALEYYQAVVRDIEIIYSFSEAEIADGACLAFFANENLSTIEAIIEANNLPSSMAITFGRTLNVPFIEE